jgi:hypothetical protein
MGLFQINTSPVGDSLAAMGQGFLEQEARERELLQREQALANQEKQLDISFERARIYQQNVESLTAEREEGRKRADAMVRLRPDVQATRKHLFEVGGSQSLEVFDHFTPADDEFWAIVGKSLPEIEKRRKDKDLKGLMELERAGILEPVKGADGKEVSWIQAQIAAGAKHDELMEASRVIVGEKRQEQKKRRGAESLRDRIKHDLETPVIAGSLAPEDVTAMREALSDVEFILERNPSDEEGLKDAWQRYKDATDDEDTRQAKVDAAKYRRLVESGEIAEREHAANPTPYGGNPNLSPEGRAASASVPPYQPGPQPVQMPPNAVGGGAPSAPPGPTGGVPLASMPMDQFLGTIDSSLPPAEIQKLVDEHAKRLGLDKEREKALKEAGGSPVPGMSSKEAGTALGRLGAFLDDLTEDDYRDAGDLEAMVIKRAKELGITGLSVDEMMDLVDKYKAPPDAVYPKEHLFSGDKWQSPY